MGYFLQDNKSIKAAPSINVSPLSKAELLRPDDSILRSAGSYLTEALIARGGNRPLQAGSLEATKLRADFDVIKNLKFARQAQLS